jgi:hypothetical protein
MTQAGLQPNQQLSARQGQGGGGSALAPPVGCPAGVWLERGQGGMEGLMAGLAPLGQREEATDEVPLQDLCRGGAGVAGPARRRRREAEGWGMDGLNGGGEHG